MSALSAALMRARDARSLRRDLNSGPRSYQERALTAGATKARPISYTTLVPGAGLEPASTPSKAVRPTQLDDPGPREPPPGLEPGACRLQGDCSGLVSYRGTGAYARRDSNPQPHGPQPCPSTCLRHERMRAATRCRPGPSAVRRRSRNRARRRSYRDWNRTSVPKFQRLGGMPNNPPGIGTGDASRTRKRLLLRKPGLPVAVTPACAARDLNPDLTS
jgi:hypothetical protein